MGARRKGRILAFQSLYSYELCKTDRQLQINEILEFPWMEARSSGKFDQESIDFGRLIARGTIENLSAIDRYITSQLEHWDFSRLNKVDQAILRISVYSLLFQKDIPPTVTIDEAVDISKDFGTDDSYRFINGVLDGIRKNLEH